MSLTYALGNSSCQSRPAPTMSIVVPKALRGLVWCVKRATRQRASYSHARADKRLPKGIQERQHGCLALPTSPKGDSSGGRWTSFLGNKHSKLNKQTQRPSRQRNSKPATAGLPTRSSACRKFSCFSKASAAASRPRSRACTSASCSRSSPSSAGPARAGGSGL